MIPSFIRENAKANELGKLITEYREKIADDICNETLHLTEEQLEKVLRECLESGKTFTEVMNLGEITGEDY